MDGVGKFSTASIQARLSEFADLHHINGEADEDNHLYAATFQLVKNILPFMTLDDFDDLGAETQIDTEERYKLCQGPVSAPENSVFKTYFCNLLTERLNSLPRTFVLRFEMPNLSIEDIDLSVRASFKQQNRGTLAKLRPSTSEIEYNNETEKKSTYLRIAVNGYAGLHDSTSGTSSALGHAKQVLSYLHLLKIFVPRYSWIRSAIEVQGFDQGYSELIYSPEDLSRACAELVPSSRFIEIWCRGPVQPDLDRVRSTLTKILDGDELDEFTPLRIALEWRLTSHFTGNDTLAFVAGCIGLEALLSDPKENISQMTARLADRFAFQIGKNRAERQALIEKFTRVFDVRGKLVHAKQRALDSSAKEALDLLHDLLDKLLLHELRLQVLEYQES